MTLLWSGRKPIFHWNAHLWIFLKSLFKWVAEVLISCTTEKREVSFEKTLAFVGRSSERSLIWIKIIMAQVWILEAVLPQYYSIQTNIFENSKIFPTPYLQLVDLLKSIEMSMSCHFTQILSTKVSHHWTCKTSVGKL